MSVRAGAGLIREIGFQDMRNATISIGSQSGATAPFTYRPSAYVDVVQFSVARPGSSSWTVNLSIVDDCGAWPTFVGGGENSGPRGALTGTVRNGTTSQAVAGATVSVHGAQRSETSQSNGGFSLRDLPVGYPHA